MNFQLQNGTLHPHLNWQVFFRQTTAVDMQAFLTKVVLLRQDLLKGKSCGDTSIIGVSPFVDKSLFPDTETCKT